VRKSSNASGTLNLRPRIDRLPWVLFLRHVFVVRYAALVVRYATEKG